MPNGWEIAKKAPAKKNTKKWCRGKVGVEHVLDIRKGRYFESLGDRVICRWRATWKGWSHGGWDALDPKWLCFHEEYCVNCGKITRTQLDPKECPNFHEWDGLPVSMRYP